MSRRWGPLAILSMALAALFYRLFIGEVLFWGIPSLQFYPWREAAFGALRAARLPLWNSLVGNGAPLLANYQTAAFYPPNWLYLIIPTEYAMGWVGMLHLLWAGIGMMAYLRRLNIGLLGQGVGALAYALSGYLVSRFGFLTITSAAPWLPWLLWAVDGILENVSRHRVTLLTGVVGMLLLAGHAQTAFYALLYAGLYALWRARWRWRELATALGGVLLGAALAAIQLVPTFELMRQSSRASGIADQDFALGYSFWPWRLSTLIAPNLFGSPATSDWWGEGVYWEDAAYVGLFVLVMAGHALFRWVRERETHGRIVAFFALTIPPVMILALGRYTPVFPFLYRHAPTFDLFQAPTRWVLLAVFAFASLGAIGADSWRTSEQGLFWTRLLTAGGLSFFFAAWWAQRMALAIEPTFLCATIRLGATVISLGLLALLQPGPVHRLRGLWESGVLVLLALDLVTAHWGLAPTSPASVYYDGSPLAEVIPDGTRMLYPPDDEDVLLYQRFLMASTFDLDANLMRQTLPPNMGMLLDIPSANNFDPLRIGDYDTLIENLRDCQLAETTQAARQMGVSTLLVTEPLPELTLLSHVGPAYAYHITAPWPRASLADCEQSNDALQCAPRSGDTVTLRDPRPERLIFTFEASEDSYLLLLDTWYPGWRAELDGEPAPILRANEAFRAVQVPAGAHTLQMIYRPLSLWLGAVVSAVAVVVLIALSRCRL